MVNGVNITVVTQFLRMVKGYIESFKPNHVYIVWDKRLNPTGDNYRKELVDYKGHRNIEDDVRNEIFDAIDLIIELTQHLGIKNMYPWNLEADDVAAYLTTTLEGDKVVISSDRDLLQLASENTVVFNTTKNVKVTLENFEEFTGVPKECFVDYKAILGDKSDNVIGLDRYGEVKSKRLAISKEWDTLTTDQVDILKRNRKIMDLTKSIALSEGEIESYDTQLDELVETNTFNESELRSMCDTYRLTAVTRDITSWRSLLNNKNLLEEWFSFS